MKISGLQTLTLLDFPGKVACTVFTPGCNFRCPFCHNASLVFSKFPELDIEEVFSLLRKRKGMLDGVCVTGGEPLMQRDIDKFFEKVKSMGYLIKLDTNGTFPEKLEELIEKKLVDYVAMDIKNSRENYSKATGVDSSLLANIERSVEILKNSKVEHEFRTTTVKGIHTSRDFKDIAQWLDGEENYFIQQYVVADDMIGEAFECFSQEELESFADIVRQRVKNVSLRGI